MPKQSVGVQKHAGGSPRPPTAEAELAIREFIVGRAIEQMDLARCTRALADVSPDPAGAPSDALPPKEGQLDMLLRAWPVIAPDALDAAHVHQFLARDVSRRLHALAQKTGVRTVCAYLDGQPVDQRAWLLGSTTHDVSSFGRPQLRRLQSFVQALHRYTAGFERIEKRSRRSGATTKAPDVVMGRLLSSDAIRAMTATELARHIVDAGFPSNVKSLAKVIESARTRRSPRRKHH